MQTFSDNSASSFKLFKRFHLFYYSYKDNQTHFLLRQKKSRAFSEIRGRLELHDPAILFSVARKVMEISSGLLAKDNMQYFAENSKFSTVDRDMLQLCKPRQSMPSMLNSKVYQKFIEDVFEDMKPFQESDNDDAYYFIEIPYLDLEKLHGFCKENKIGLQLKYATKEEILNANSINNIHVSVKELFTQQLDSYVETFIENKELIPIKARYAVVCILTTPTNYRTMGLLGSYYKKHGDLWKFYRFPLEEPSLEELAQLDGLLIPGATVCAADKSLVWRDKLLSLIKTVYEDYPLCKILGTCFGIQIISEALSGRCERMKEFIRGTSQLAITKQFWELPFVKELGIEAKPQMIITKSHFDNVTQPPETVTVYASSEACSVEIMGVEDRLLAFQGHPEINEAWTACLLYQAANEKMNFKVYYEEVKNKYFKEKLEHEFWLKIVFNFFKKKELAK